MQPGRYRVFLVTWHGNETLQVYTGEFFSEKQCSESRWMLNIGLILRFWKTCKRYRKHLKIFYKVPVDIVLGPFKEYLPSDLLDFGKMGFSPVSATFLFSFFFFIFKCHWNINRYYIFIIKINLD